jgi:hypothetical protein
MKICERTVVRIMRRTFSSLWFVSVLVVGAGSARGQDSQTTLRGGFATGAPTQQSLPGVLVGEGVVLHPSVGLETNYDSNVFYDQSSSEAAPSLRVMPRLELGTRVGSDGSGSTGAVSFQARLGGEYREYLTDVDVVRDQRAFAVDQGVVVNARLSPSWTFIAYEAFVRSYQNRFTASRGTINRDVLRIGPRLRYAPGGGRFETQLGYTFGFDLFEAEQFRVGNNVSHNTNLVAQWRWFPKTAIRFEADQSFIRFKDDIQAANGVLKNDSNPLRLTLGLVGLITPRLTVDVNAGYGYGFYTNGPDGSTFLAQVGLGYRMTPTTVLAAGYGHSFIDALVGNYFSVDEARLSLAQQLLGRAVFNAGFRYRRYSYEGFIAQPGEFIDGDSRVDNRYEAVANLDYLFTGTLAGGVGYTGDFNRSNYTSGGTIAAALNSADYSKHIVWARLTASY